MCKFSGWICPWDPFLTVWEPGCAPSDPRVLEWGQSEPKWGVQGYHKWWESGKGLRMPRSAQRELETSHFFIPFFWVLGRHYEIYYFLIESAPTTGKWHLWWWLPTPKYISNSCFRIPRLGPVCQRMTTHSYLSPFRLHTPELQDVEWCLHGPGWGNLASPGDNHWRSLL